MTTQLTRRFDVLRAAIGLFVLLGVVLTAAAGYALLPAPNVAISADLAVAVLSGVSLVAFATLLTTWLHSTTDHRVRRQRRGSA